MAITASKNSFAKGRLCASSRKGKTLASQSRATARLRFSLGDVSASAAQTSTPNSRARKIELVALPHPRSRIRIPARNERRRERLSAWHSAFSPNALSRIHCGSYFAASGKASSRKAFGEIPSAFIDSSLPILLNVKDFENALPCESGRKRRPIFSNQVAPRTKRAVFR